jgi:hypothetical protein
VFSFHRTARPESGWQSYPFPWAAISMTSSHSHWTQYYPQCRGSFLAKLAPKGSGGLITM